MATVGVRGLNRQISETAAQPTASKYCYVYKPKRLRWVFWCTVILLHLNIPTYVFDISSSFKPFSFVVTVAYCLFFAQLWCHVMFRYFLLIWRVQKNMSYLLLLVLTRKPSYRWLTRATRKPAKNCSNSTYVLTTLSLTILAYLHSFSCCCVRNLRNPAKFTENSSL